MSKQSPTSSKKNPLDFCCCCSLSVQQKCAHPASVEVYDNVEQVSIILNQVIFSLRNTNATPNFTSSFHQKMLHAATHSLFCPVILFEDIQKAVEIRIIADSYVISLHIKIHRSTFENGEIGKLTFALTSCIINTSISAQLIFRGYTIA